MPFARRSSRSEGLSSWIYSKHILPIKSRRYFNLSNQVLSCHGAPASRAKWEIDLPGASVLGSQKQMRIAIRSRGRGVKLYLDTDQAYSNWLTALQASASQRIEDQYEFGERIGAGAFGQVLLAVDKCSLERCAVKIIDKIPDDPMDEEYIWRELNCMRSISHPDIVRTFNIFDTRERLYLVLEYMPGGSLKKVLARTDHFPEAQTKSIVKDILQGTAYLHEMSIVHRDLKLDNILCSDTEFPFRVKIADFGLANFIGAVTISKGLQSQVGSPHYIAPEVLRDERYGPLVDSWSIGVMMHIMLTRMYPFAGGTLQETLEQVVVGRVSFNGPEWKGVSREAKSLLKGLLQEDVNERLSPQQALGHAWFSTCPEQQTAPRTGRVRGRVSGGGVRASGRVSVRASGRVGGRMAGASSYKTERRVKDEYEDLH